MKHIQKLGSIAFILLVTTKICQARGGHFRLIDAHALAAPKVVESQVSSLAKYLSCGRPKHIWDPRTKFWTRNYGGDEATAREIFCWVTDRIAYDYRSITLKSTSNEANAILKRRFAVCHDYAVLYTAIAKEAGLTSIYIGGFAETSEGLGPHAWNAVNIGGEWRMVDCCWGSGFVDGTTFYKKFAPEWFEMTPERFIQSHFPDNDYYFEDCYSFLREMSPVGLRNLRKRFRVSPPTYEPALP